MNYVETSLAIVEYKINELHSQKKYYDKRLKELIEIRDNCIRAINDSNRILTPEEINEIEEK